MSAVVENESPGRKVATILQSNDFKVKISQALPPGMSEYRFTRAVITAIQANPSIVEADKASLYSSIVQAAHAGLHLDGKEAALVVFNTKQGDRYVKKVQFMPMIGGLVKRLGGAGVTVSAEVVYENDEFAVEYGDDPKITHKPPPFGKDRGKGIGAYAILRAKDGAVYREVMSREQIEAVQSQSRAKDSLMWTRFWTEAWRKSVIRRAAKRVPIEDALVEATTRADDATFDYTDEIPAVDEATVVAEQPKPAPVPTKRSRPKAYEEAVRQRDAELPDEPPELEMPPLDDEREVF